MIQVGDKVKVRASVEEPRHGWGAVTHKSVGAVSGPRNGVVLVNFPETYGWKADPSDIVPYFEPGEKARVLRKTVDRSRGVYYELHRTGLEVGDVVAVKAYNTTYDSVDIVEWSSCFLAEDLEPIREQQDPLHTTDCSKCVNSRHDCSCGAESENDDTLAEQFGARLEELVDEEAQIDEIIRKFREELTSAISRYPDWPADPVHAACILVEEAGEALKESNNYYWGHKRTRAESLERMEKEAIQAGAMAIRFLIGMGRYEVRR